MLADSVDNTQPTGAPGVAIDPDTSLAAAPGEYLRALHRGLTLMLVAFAISIAVTCPFFITYFFLILTRTAMEAIVPLAMGFSILMMLVGIIGWIGKYLLTVPDPRGVWNESFENYRRVLRGLLWIHVLMAPIALGLAYMAWSSMSSAGSIPTGIPASGPSSPFGLEFFARMLLQLVAVVLSFANIVFLMLYFEQIGMRLHDPWIAARAKMLVWLVPVLMLLFCTIVGPIAAVVLQVQMYWRVRGRVGGLVRAGGDAPS